MMKLVGWFVAVLTIWRGDNFVSTGFILWSRSVEVAYRSTERVAIRTSMARKPHDLATPTNKAAYMGGSLSATHSLPWRGKGCGRSKGIIGRRTGHRCGGGGNDLHGPILWRHPRLAQQPRYTKFRQPANRGRRYNVRQGQQFFRETQIFQKGRGIGIHGHDESGLNGGPHHVG